MKCAVNWEVIGYAWKYLPDVLGAEDEAISVDATAVDMEVVIGTEDGNYSRLYTNFLFFVLLSFSLIFPDCG